MAARILALGDAALRRKLQQHTEQMAREVEEKHKKLECL
jgi:phosphoribosylcarboxyaminoimidazole (NCAIR) mutase